MALTPTIRDVARQAGVSHTTVSLAFQQDSRISPDTRKAVLAIARRLQYLPNPVAKALRDGRTRTVGFLVPDITNPFYTLMIDRADAVAQRRGYQVVVVDSKADADREVRGVRGMVQSRVQGALVCLCEKTEQSGAILRDGGVPAIALDTFPRGYRGPFVGNDVPRAGRLAADHLFDAGCRRPVMVTASRDMASFSGFVRLREGFGRALRARGVTFDASHVIHAGTTIAAGLDAFNDLRRRAPDADGVFCANDLCALGLIDAAGRAGVRVGPDLAVMGIDDIDLAALSCVSLTSIHQPHARLAELAAEALLDSIDTGTPPAIRTTLPPELRARASTDRSRA